MKIAHYCNGSRSLGNLSGVPKFAHYLNKVIPEIKLFDHRVRGSEQECFNYVKDNGLLIVDSFLALKFPTSIPKIIVAHGCVATRIEREGIKWEDDQRMEWQKRAFNMDNAIKIAVSEEAAQTCEKYYDCLINMVIPNGLDEFEYQPRDVEKRDKPLIFIHVADSVIKGLSKIKKLQTHFNLIDFNYLGANKAGEEFHYWNKGHFFIQPSLREGCSYATLEAMACDLPGIYSKVGFIKQLRISDESMLGRFIDWDAPIEAWTNGIEYLMKNRDKFKPRDWFLKSNCTIGNFKKNWLTAIEFTKKMLHLKD